MTLPTPVSAPPHITTKCVADGRRLNSAREVIYPARVPWTYCCAEHVASHGQRPEDLAIEWRSTFDTQFEQHAARQGQPFKVVGIIDQPDDDHDAEVLPMYVVRFDDGEEIEAWPEEVTVPAEVRLSPPLTDPDAVQAGYDARIATDHGRNP